MWNRIQSASRTRLAAIAIALAAILFLCVNLIASLSLDAARIDLTENRLYTVSDSTRNVLAKVEEPITIRLYLSSMLLNDYPVYRTYAERVIQILETYERLSSGRVRYERIDPQPFTPEEDRAIGYNLTGVNLSRAGEKGYFGIVGTNAVDQLEVIEFMNPRLEPFLEYDMSRMVSRLTQPSEARVGVIDGLGLFGSQALGRQPSDVIALLGADFALQALSNEVTVIPEDIDALVLIHPHNLTDSALYAVDQYVIRGGPLVVFVDPLSEMSPFLPNSRQRQYPSSYLERLLTAWGIEMVPDSVVGDGQMLRPLQVQVGPNETRNLPGITFLAANERLGNFNPDEPAVGALQVLMMTHAGSLRPLDGATTEFVPLIRTTPDSMLYEQSRVAANPNPLDLYNAFVPSGMPQVLAARVTGIVSTAFPDGPPPPPRPGQDEEPPPDPLPLMAQSEEPISVIVVADTDMLNNQNIAVPGNNDFVVNAIDTLTGGTDLIELRSREDSRRPFLRVDAIEREAQDEYLATRQQLEAELAEANAELEQLGGAVVTEDGQVIARTVEQQELIAAAQARISEVNRQLRDVQRALRQDIDALSDRLRLINILAIPAALVLIGLIVAIWRRARLAAYLRRRRVAA
ncbi:MAG: GldG family protein [Bauldia sp.]|nr:GldG family protein [Bauldia sp.]